MTTVSIQTHQGMTTPWRDTALPVAERVELLLTEMTLEEKVAQLGSRWVGNDMQAERPTEPSPAGKPESTFNVAPLQDVFAASGKLSLGEASTYGLGHLTRPGLRPRQKQFALSIFVARCISASLAPQA